MVVFKQFHWASSPSYSQRRCYFFQLPRQDPGFQVSHTDTSYIPPENKWEPLPQKFPLLPTHGLFSANGNSLSVTRPCSQGYSGWVRDACWPDRWDPWWCRAASQRGTLPFWTLPSQRNSQKEKDPTATGCLNRRLSKESDWALFGWAWAQVQILREFMDRI